MLARVFIGKATRRGGDKRVYKTRNYLLGGLTVSSDYPKYTLLFAKNKINMAGQLQYQFVCVRGYEFPERFIAKEVAVLNVKVVEGRKIRTRSNVLFKAPLDQTGLETTATTRLAGEMQIALRWHVGTEPFENLVQWFKDHVGTDPEVRRFVLGVKTCVFLRDTLQIDTYDLTAYGFPEVTLQSFNLSAVVSRCDMHTGRVGTFQDFEFCAIACAERAAVWFEEDYDQLEPYFFVPQNYNSSDPRFLSVSLFRIGKDDVVKEIAVMSGVNRKLAYVVFEPPAKFSKHKMNAAQLAQLEVQEQQLAIAWESGTTPYDQMETWVGTHVEDHGMAQWFVHGAQTCVWLRRVFGIDARDLRKYGFPMSIRRSDFEDITSVLRCKLHDAHGTTQHYPEHCKAASAES